MISVAEALAAVLRGVEPVDRIGSIGLRDAIGRTLAEPIHASRAQSPFDASAMDGYAVRAEDAREGAVLRMIGTVRAGEAAPVSLEPGTAIRIFTGAAVPTGVDSILIQENAKVLGPDRVRVTAAPEPGRYIRRSGLDFADGDRLCDAGTVVDPGLVTLLASANIPEVRVREKPRVAVIATGDELVPLGVEPRAHQIVASSILGVAALIEGFGGEALEIGIAADSDVSLDEAFDEAAKRQADLVVTLGGASVGDYDLVRPVLSRRGIEFSFEKVAMRPGKPLMHGRDQARLYVGLPGNPVSSLVCTHVFLAPLIARLLGHPYRMAWRTGILGRDLPANDEREEFMRATIARADDGPMLVPFRSQDSSLVSRYANADALVHRPVEDPPRQTGDACRYIELR